MNGVLPETPRAPTTMETPGWFFSDSSCNTVESQRAEKRLAEQVKELQKMCVPTFRALRLIPRRTPRLHHPPALQLPSTQVSK